ncbi:MAG: energy transducer TonB [Bacteroidaceae bacterium]|nr:energy transducer TonB [Bacteroidaceae bacterium]
MVLLVIVVLSLVLSLCDVHFLSLNLLMAEEQGGGIVDVGIPVYVMDGVAVDEVAEALPEDEGFFSSVNWWAVAGWIYLIGMVVTILVKLVQLAMLYRTIHRGVLWTERKDGVRIYCHAGDITPFSWFNTIVISENDYEENAQVIIRHEIGHIVNYHSLDIILVNICEVIQWCNPLSWILVGSLRDVHEYEADDAVLASGVEVHRYQLLLIKKAVGSSSYAFANSFNHSLLKKRITMMVSKKSNLWMRTKALYIIPVALVALSAFATPEFVAPIEEAVAESTPAVDISENEAVVQSNIVSEKTVEEPSVKDVDEKVGLKDYLIIINGKESTISDLKKLEIEPTTVAYVCGLDGVRDDLRELGFLKIVYFRSEKAVMNAYVEKGFAKAKNGIVSISNWGEGNLFEVCEDMPSFPGGETECMSFVRNNMKYPQVALENGIQGRVIVSFIVGKDGVITDVKAIRFNDNDIFYNDGSKIVLTQKEYSESGYNVKNIECHEGEVAFINEAVRVVKDMPAWKPGFQRNQPVACRYEMPITIRLQ